MAFKEVSDLSADTTTAIGGFNKATKKDNPTKAEGFYLGSRQTPNKKTGGMSNIYFLQTSKGNLGIWGKTDLDKKMVQVPVGVMIKIEFAGMLETPKGEMYRYKVAVDDENTIDVVQPVKVASKPPQFDEDESIDADSAHTTTVEEADDEDAEQAKALLAAERKAKVQALLSKNKKGA